MNPVSTSWLYGTVKTHFLKCGIKLLKDDMLFIERCLANIPQERHRLVMRDYLAIWSTKVAERNNSSPIAVNPRFEANSFLRSITGFNAK